MDPLQNCPKEICRECMERFIQDRIEQKHIFYLKDDIINIYNVIVRKDKKSSRFMGSVVEYFYQINEFIQQNLSHIYILYEMFNRHKNISPCHTEDFLVRDSIIKLSQLAQRLYNFIDKRIDFHYLVLDYFQAKGIIIQEIFTIIMSKIKDIHNLNKKCIVCQNKNNSVGRLCVNCFIDLQPKFVQDLETITKMNPIDVNKENIVVDLRYT